MTKKFKSSLLLLFLVQLFFAQESEWHWQNPYPLPFIHEIHQGVDDWLIVQHASGDMYQINDDGSFTELDMNLPPFNYVNGFVTFKLISKEKWIVFSPYVIYITNDGGKTYNEYSSDKNWQYSQPQFIDELNGVAFRVFGNTEQVVKTLNGGQTWHVIYSGTLPQAFQIVSKEIIYILTSGSDSKIIRTIDGGNNWEERGDCKYCEHIQKVGNNLLLEAGPFVYLSEDDGNSLTQVLSTYDENLNFQIESKSTVYDNIVVKSNAKRLFKSIDGGYTWEEFETGYPNLSIFNGYCRNENSLFFMYSGHHKGVMKLDIANMTLKPILGTPINDFVEFQKLDSDILAISAYNSATSQHRVYTSDDNGYSWNRHTLILPDNKKYVATPLLLKSDSSAYVTFQDHIYYYQNFTKEYTSKIPIDSIPYLYNRSYSLQIDDDGKGYLIGSPMNFMYYSDDYFENYEKINLPKYRFSELYERSDGRYWILGHEAEDYKKGVVCILNDKVIDTCFSLQGGGGTITRINDDLVLGVEEAYPVGNQYNSETGMMPFCAALPGKVLSILSDDKMIVQNQNLLYLANPQTCEVIESIELNYLEYMKEKSIDFKFVQLANEDILGYGSGGYMMRKTDNFLDTLLYNSSKEVEYETPAQEHQFLVYPNPTSDWLQVKDMPYGVECRIIDMTGREYMHGKQSLIYTGQYPSGTYIIQFIQDGRLIESQKIVIQ